MLSQKSLNAHSNLIKFQINMRNTSDSKIFVVLHLFTSACLIFNAGCEIYFLSKNEYSWSLKLGKNIKSTCLNVGYYVNISVLLWIFTTLFFAIFEIYIIFKVSPWLDSIFRGLFRPFLYIAMGLANFGICNDLGIIAGVFILIMAVVWLILNSYAMCNSPF